MTVLPDDYVERVYAGALGKVIGVYLGRPVEGWTHDRIASKLGEIDYYVHDKVGVPLLVTDDDIAGTFTFIRALPDYGNDIGITAAQIGQTWLNYIVEDRTTLWWGGLGNSTEHTAYLRLKRGVPAPRSGSMQLNGQVVAEQIGAQIFVDGWAMVAPGRPELAADLARRAASVSHDGEAVHAARLLAAMQAQAFVESDVDKLLDTGLSYVPSDCVVAQVIGDVRDWHRHEPDWRHARALLESRYGYHRYGGNCHVIPNHGLIVLALLYGAGDWDESMVIVNTAGWDTDCNAGNLGCLLGIRNGLSAFEGRHDWRGPVADRIYVPSAAGGTAITDVATEAIRIANIGRSLVGEAPLRPKGGAQFHFDLAGALQGFQVDRGRAAVASVAGHTAEGTYSLAIRPDAGSPEVAVCTPTFTPPEAIAMPIYELIASPTLYAGQLIRAVVSADASNEAEVMCRLMIKHYNGEDEVVAIDGTPTILEPGRRGELSWTVPDTAGQPVQSVGIVVANGQRGSVYLDRLGWEGEPDIKLDRPADGGSMWRRSWIDCLDQFSTEWPEPYRLIQNDGRGMLIHGTNQWRDYQVSATFTPHLADAAGLAARVQGLRRYYALVICSAGTVSLIKVRDGERVLAQAPMRWELGRPYSMSVEVAGSRLSASVDGVAILSADDPDSPLETGGIGLLCENGRVGCDAVRVRAGSSKVSS
jgi:ADP-ribosylglycohydrolase